MEEQEEQEEFIYEDEMDRLFSKRSNWKHRTLRTVFDPYSHEWGQTNYAEKIQILEKIVNSKMGLQFIILKYKLRYIKQGRKDISSNLENALWMLLEYQLASKE